ncbi:MAG TPA: hypothetical protein VN665_01445, partial [Candidatus Paceibacterota bacterium]|nr:hypothetical protein [Candidatus Paceibacterota bacterium]
MAMAATPTCSANGYTVVYVNGVFDTLEEAKANKAQFQLIFDRQNGGLVNGQPVNFQLGYNPSHLNGLGDVAQSVAQLFGTSISSFDLDTVLMQIYPEVQTRKLLLVGHSQGAFYTNSMYSYLLSHGEPNSSVAVYNVASPATYTAGGGKYLNSSGDNLLFDLRAAHLDILPNNIDLIPANETDFFPGHSFVNDYLDNAGTQMLADMSTEMSNLQPTDASNIGDCFTPPQQDTSYTAEQIG